MIDNVFALNTLNANHYCQFAFKYKFTQIYVIEHAGAVVAPYWNIYDYYILINYRGWQKKQIVVVKEWQTNFL